MKIDLAVIGGTGVYDPAMLEDVQDKIVNTIYGDAAIKLGSYQGRRVAFLARHGTGHSVPPHLINYRANILALKMMGVKQIVATAAVGSLNLAMNPGKLVVIDQFLDFTKARPSTFFDGGEEGVIHVDVTHPYCPRLGSMLEEAGSRGNLAMIRGGTYVCTEGPRFETPAEIKMMKQLGGDLVGMTSVPEATLAREAEMCYASVALVTNFAAGISPTPLTHMEVVEFMQKNVENIKLLLKSLLENLTEADCECRRAVADFGGFQLHKKIIAYRCLEI